MKEFLRGSKDFFRTYLAVLLALITFAIPMAKADPPAGNGGPGVNPTSPLSSVVIGGTSFNPTFDLSTTQNQNFLFGGNNSFSGTNSFSNTSTFTGQMTNQNTTQTTCPGAGTPIANEVGAYCIGPVTGTVGILMGKVSGNWGGTTSSNSAALRFARNNGTADSTCDMLYAAGGSLSVGCSISSNSNNITAGSGTLTAGHFTQNATGNFAGHCTMSAGTTCTVTLTSAYTTPNCTATENVSATPVAAGVTIATTTVTVTAASSNSATWFVHCVGDPT